MDTHDDEASENEGMTWLRADNPTLIRGLLATGIWTVEALAFAFEVDVAVIERAAKGDV